MDTLKAQLLRIQQQLNGLSASQKMLTASLVAIMVMTIIWWGKYAGTAEMEAVIDSTLSPADMGKIKSVLDANGIETKIVGDRVMVSADQKHQAFVTLAYADALPSDSANAWDDMIKEMTLWDSKSKTDLLVNQMHQQVIASIISGFKGVASAHVIINSVEERRVGDSLVPTASVSIKTRGDDYNVKQLVTAAASTVASAVPGLSRAHVAVVVDSVTYYGHDPSDSFAGDDLSDLIKGEERHSCEKIMTALGVPGALIGVTVDMDINSSQQTTDTFDQKTTFSKEETIENKTDESSTPQNSAAEPGAVTNTGLALSQVQASNNASDTREENRTTMHMFPAETRETTNKPAGKTAVLSASVSIPRSYLISQYKMINPKAGEPDESAIQKQLADDQTAWRNQVRAVTGIKSDDGVTISSYFDITNAMPDGVTAQASMTGGLGTMVGGHAKEIALGVLAVISLFMVSMIVKKGTPIPPVPQVVEPRETPRLAGAEDIAGIVGGEHQGTLDAMEVDDDAIKSQQMVEQVATMVKENPDAAANLVKRWLNRT